MKLSQSSHEQIVLRQDPQTGLRAIIAVHSTLLGPAAGGCRHWIYPDLDSAMADALRLSEGMTLKNALADIPFGGGKSVILGCAGSSLSPAQLATFGGWVEELSGRYITAEDVGIGVAELRHIARATRFVSGVGRAGIGGDPSPRTALGVFHGIRAAVAHRFGVADLQGLRVAVQGLGNVGYHLCRLLSEHGAELLVADLDGDRVACAEHSFGARGISVADVLRADVDVLAPCALGGVLTHETVEQLRTSVIAGAANNQLACEEVGDHLLSRGVLYAPDYIINAGGVISIAQEYLGITDPAWASERVSGIASRLQEVLHRSAATGTATNRVAEAMARQRLQAENPNPTAKRLVAAV